MKHKFAIAAAWIFSASCAAESIKSPDLKPGDEWIYLDTIEKGLAGWKQKHDEITVSRVTASSIYFTSKESGSTQPAKDIVAGADWSRIRDLNGTQTVVNKPLSFPLSEGKNWEVEYTEMHPNPEHRSEHIEDKFKVVGFESIEVPAGTFNALKIEVEGLWTAEVAPTLSAVQAARTESGTVGTTTQIKHTDAKVASGRVYKAFWYAPEVKRWVKSVEEYYGSNGQRNERYTGELESFKVAD